MASFELVLQGFDGGTDATDHLILWVAADSQVDVEQFLTAYGFSLAVEFGDDLPDAYDKDDGIDYVLPAEAAQLKVRIQELLAANPS